ncbi:MAG: phosphate acetyltransferase [Ignavibacteria bacterium]|nr:phosphate acetyltransferase [Ignavibacteria bacterium]
MSQSFTNSMREKASKLSLKVAFADSEDIRTLKSAIILKEQGIAKPILVGNEAKIKELAEKENVSLKEIEIVEPEKSEHLEKFANMLYEKRKSKGMTESEALAIVKTPLYFAGFMLETDLVKVAIAGNVSATGDVIRASIFTVGVAAGISIVSSYFIMVLQDGRKICFADCAVNPDPTEEQLADIAISSARNFASVTGEEARVAMLSFSTKGSANHPDVDKVVAATKIVQEKAPDLLVDGEMQADAALVASIGERKCKGSPVAGKANVLIFPDLNSANIGYKLTERLAGAEAVGPFVQGLKKPYCDLSRGCSVDDMVNVAAICSLMA